MSEPYQPFHFNSLMEAVDSFKKDPLSPLSFPKIPKLQPVSNRSSISIHIQDTNSNYIFHVIGQVIDDEKFSHNMNLTEDEKVHLLSTTLIHLLISILQLTNAAISKFKPRFPLLVPGYNEAFRNKKLANHMRNQNLMFRDIETYLETMTGKKAKNGEY